MTIAELELQSSNSSVSFSKARLDAIKRRVRDLEHKSLRQPCAPDLLTECENGGLSWPQRAPRLVHRMCEAEQPVIYPDERIVFTRTVPNIPAIYAPEVLQQMTAGKTLHELGPISNICADWEMVLSQGLVGRQRIAQQTLSRIAADSDAVEFLECALETIDAVLDLASRYAEHARSIGKTKIAQILERVPALPPRTFHEALQSLRLMYAVVWMAGHSRSRRARLRSR